jgi:SAM-dependent methyltransferase
MQLVCPVDRRPLIRHDDGLHCAAGHSYPVIHGIPVLLRGDVASTIPLMRASLEARGNDPLFLETVGVSEEERAIARRLAASGVSVDPVAAVLVAATNGRAYEGMVGQVSSYPIPELPLPKSEGSSLLDVGCSWGRWSIAAARKGYRVTGIDPSLGALLAAKRVSTKMGLGIDFVCGDARYLPFADSSFANVYSYSVLQHFSREDAALALGEAGRVLQPEGALLVQLAHAGAFISLLHRMRRGFRAPKGFEVRYWSLRELRETFGRIFHAHEVRAHCLFGLGLEPSDRPYLPARARMAISVSEALRSFRLMRRLADSVYVEAWKSSV